MVLAGSCIMRRGSQIKYIIKSLSLSLSLSLSFFLSFFFYSFILLLSPLLATISVLCDAFCSCSKAAFLFFCQLSLQNAYFVHSHLDDFHTVYNERNRNSTTNKNLNNNACRSRTRLLWPSLDQTSERTKESFRF